MAGLWLILMTYETYGLMALAYGFMINGKWIY